MERQPKLDAASFDRLLAQNARRVSGTSSPKTPAMAGALRACFTEQHQVPS
jgi:hypothetical protein